MIRTLVNRILKAQAPPAPRPPAPIPGRYTESELLSRVEEFNRNAEVYWDEIRRNPKAREQALNKPCGTTADAAATYYRLGLVLNDLRPGPGHTILDFGAGACWLSAYLNRLGCRTISIDISPSALELGKALFSSDQRQRPDLKPEFVPFDGRHIPLPDAHVDRIVCFDAFHHIPNQTEIVRELARVLKPGGRVVMAEPGEGHSHADLSVWETERFGVLENDLDLEDVARKARDAGFTSVRLKPYPHPDLSLPVEDYLRLIRGEREIFPIDHLRENLRRFYLIVLEKGQAAPDSRAPGLLSASIRLVNNVAALRAGSTANVSIDITNTGDTVWLHEESPSGGYVALGGHLLGKDGALIATEYIRRVGLGRDVSPGETVRLDALVNVPAELGSYIVRLDLVDDQVTWFENRGSKPLDLPLEITELPEGIDPRAHQAEITVVEAPASVGAGSVWLGKVTIANKGKERWSPLLGEDGPINLGLSLAAMDGRLLSRDYARVALSHDVEPGAEISLPLSIVSPMTPGTYTIRFDMVFEGHFWFAGRGSLVTLLPLHVTQAKP